MAKGSVRKKGKRWHHRFYIEDESGNRVRKEYPGTESKSETEALLRKAIDKLLGHSDVNMTLNVYAHAARDSKRNCVKLLDKLETG